MRRSASSYIVIALLVLLASTVGAARRWDDESRSRKADYIFVEAQNAFNHEDFASYLTLLQHAYDLDSSDIDIAGEWAMSQFTLAAGGVDADPNPDPLHSYNLLRRRFLANPTFTNGKVFSSVATQLRRFDDVVMVWEMLDSIYPTSQDAAEYLADAYVKKSIVGDTTALDRALAIYKRLEDGAGKSIGLSSQIIRAHFLRNDTTSVERELLSLMRSAPSDSYTALFIGSTFEYLQRPDSALKYIDLACALDSANGNAYMARAAFYRQRGDSVAFDREVFHALNSSDLEVETKLDMLRSYVSELYMDSTQHQRISALFEHLQLLHPATPEIHSLYGAYLSIIGKHAEGAEQMGYAVSLDPANEATLTAYVQILGLAGQTAKVLAETAAASKKFPENLYFPILRASTLQKEHLIDSALAVMDSVNISTVNNPNAVSNFIGYKGDLLAANGDTIAALETYDKAITLNPDNIGAMNNAAYFMSLTPGADLEKALRYSSRAIKAEPNNATYLDTYAWILFKTGDLTLARQYIEATIRVYEEEIEDNADNPDYVLSHEIYDHAGDIYFKSGETEKAIEFWQKALKIAPDNAVLQQKIKEAQKSNVKKDIQ